MSSINGTGAATDETRVVDRHFARLGGGYDDFAFSNPGQQWLSARELDAVGRSVHAVARGGRVLDVGAGNGRITEFLTRLGFGVTAIDAVPDMLAAVHHRVPSACLARCRLGEPLPFRPGTFDAVVAVRVLKYVPDWPAAIAELSNLLAPGGCFVLDVANGRSLARWGYGSLPVSLPRIADARAVGAGCGIRWTGSWPGTHVPDAFWRTAPRRTLPLVVGLQHTFDRTIGSAGARSVVLVGERLPSGSGRSVGRRRAGDLEQHLERGALPTRGAFVDDVEVAEDVAQRREEL